MLRALGLLVRSQRIYRVELEDVPIIADRARTFLDVEVAPAFGCLDYSNAVASRFEHNWP
jgi:hypothetical protein